MTKLLDKNQRAIAEAYASTLTARDIESLRNIGLLLDSQGVTIDELDCEIAALKLRLKAGSNWA